MSELNWENLLEKRCPKCGKKLKNAHYYKRCSGSFGKGIYKLNEKGTCDFMIECNKYRELVKKLKINK